ncbi:MAG: hypothetical protein HYY01_13840 [Chloroflexi bacterium]|nr:hypothetical protein [Chloroflexota bacterium]
MTNADTQVSIAGQPLNSALRAAASRQGQDTEFGQGELEATSAAQQALGAVGLGQRRAPTPEGGRVIQIGGPETHFKVEKIEVTRSDDTYCPYCGDFVYKDKTHRCPRCGRYPFCPKDYDESRKLCAFCLDDEVRASTVRCSLCGQQVSTANTFECPKCHRVAGKDHLHAATGNCQPCAEEYERFVTSLRRGEPVVAGPDGKLFTPDDADKGTLVAERGALRTAEGEQVAKLKDQMWYSPQWYKLRQRRFQEEKDAMKSFYPQMALVTTPQGEAYWKGQLTTRLGKTYTIEMHYPSAFPYLPPKVYVTYPPIKKSRHIYEDGHLCLFHPDDKAWEASTTAATIVSWVAKWLHCYEVWQATGEWPGHERDQVVVTVRA